MITQDHVAKFATMTAIDRQFLLRNINHTMLLELVDMGKINTIYEFLR